MSNIYLRLPTSICYFHRNRDVNNKLTNFTPLKFSPYTDHAVVMRGGLAVATGVDRKGSCFTQLQFKNILNGRTPDGSKLVTKRDCSVWPTYAEICMMIGGKISNRSESYDYLCIQMPQTIIVGEKEVRTNSSFALTSFATDMLQDLLVNDFKRALIDWEIGTFNHCTSSPEGIIQRGHMNTLERFLMRYDIPIPKDGYEKASLRRQLDRWMEKAKVQEKAYRTIDIEYEDSKDKIIPRKI